jgi:pimeloyl-ACP methyl ester carboxylesterase
MKCFLPIFFSVILLIISCTSKEKTLIAEPECAEDNNTELADVNMDSVINEDEQWLCDCNASEPEFHMVDVGAINMHVACQGAGPTIILLHGFPEFWYSWQKVMNELAADFRLIVPDQRGYNLSDKPGAVSDYVIDSLLTDIGALIDRVSTEPVVIVGHDWGGPVAWETAHAFREKVRLMISANGPHPNVFGNLLAGDSEQQEASSYMSWFAATGTENLLMANDFAILASFFDGILTANELEVYKEAWGQENAIWGGLNWYRAASFDSAATQVTIDVPTLVLWGLDDTALLPQNLDGLDEYVPDLEIITYEEVSHWIEHEIPLEISQEIRRFVQEN